MVDKIATMPKTLQWSRKEVNTIDEESDCNDVETVYLQENQLSQFPALVEQFVNLKILDLSGNILESLDGIHHLSQLTHLYLRDNRLRSEHLDRSRISELQALERINLVGNCLVEIPLSICRLTRLTHLGLGENKISIIRPELSWLSFLNYLSLRNNYIEKIDLDFRDFPFLRGLSLAGNPIALQANDYSYIPVIQLDDLKKLPESPLRQLIHQ